ncbi:hypothetical protein [Mariniphaga sediminis]|uniref:hypothetical protein n=1 Tax=Mariniphaga sediminis TaxID=1628158 RepID=UPI00356B060F
MKLKTSQDFIDKLHKLEAKREAARMAKLAAKKTASKDLIRFPSFSPGMSSSKAAIQEMEEIKTTKARNEAIAASPDLNKLRGVRIDSRTMIYVSKRKSPEKARQEFLMRHANG